MPCKLSHILLRLAPVRRLISTTWSWNYLKQILLYLCFYWHVHQQIVLRIFESNSQWVAHWLNHIENIYMYMSCMVCQWCCFHVSFLMVIKICCYRFFNFFYIYGLYILFFVWTIGLSDYSYGPKYIYSIYYLHSFIQPDLIPAHAKRLLQKTLI